MQSDQTDTVTKTPPSVADKQDKPETPGAAPPTTTDLSVAPADDPWVQKMLAALSEGTPGQFERKLSYRVQYSRIVRSSTNDSDTLEWVTA